jgi:hypothetical protein
MIDLLIQLDVYRVTNGTVRCHRTPAVGLAAGQPRRLDVEHTDTGIEAVATGRSSWTGCLELATEPVDETSNR